MSSVKGYDFWTDARRKYVAGFVSNFVLLLMGALGTSEFLKLKMPIKIIIFIAGIVLIVLGAWIHPKKGDK